MPPPVKRWCCLTSVCLSRTSGLSREQPPGLLHRTYSTQRFSFLVIFLSFCFGSCARRQYRIITLHHTTNACLTVSINKLSINQPTSVRLSAGRLRPRYIDTRQVHWQTSYRQTSSKTRDIVVLCGIAMCQLAEYRRQHRMTYVCLP